MVKVKFAALAVLILIALTAAFLHFFQSESRRIKKRFDSLAETVEKAGDENQIAAGAAARRVGRMFAESCRIRIPRQDISRDFTPDEIAAAVMRLRKHYERISVDFNDIDIVFPEGERASVSLTASISGRTAGGEATRDVHELACGMEKREDGWVFYEIRVIEVLRR